MEDVSDSTIGRSAAITIISVLYANYMVAKEIVKS